MKTNQPAALVSTEQFLQALTEGNLLSGDDLTNTLGSADRTHPDGRVLAQRLVDAGKLTPYQSLAVLERRFEELHVGNYEVLDLLGRGGMGTVFKARHRRMKRIVALKVLAREVAAEGSFLQRFQREVETIAQLSHPNIVMAHDADEAAIGPFLVMEFVNGRDLASEVTKSGPLSVADALDCTLQAARGLEYAHGKGIIHRDIKPANLLRDVNGLVKVADLGLARLSGTPAGGSGVIGGLTQAGGIVGTTDYMPPEQALDSTSIDQRADTYSLGCTLYFLLAGRPPYSASSLMGLLLKHRDDPIPSLTATRSDVPAEVDNLYRRMVAKKPADRPSPMTEVVQALEALQRAFSGLTTRPATAASGDLGGATVAAESLSQLANQDTSHAAPSPSEAGRVADLTVVLVEPSRVQARIVSSYLQQLGIRNIHTTGAGGQALALAREVHAHVLLSAMHLSDMTGLQLAQALHADGACADVGFILASSESDSDPGGTFARHPRSVLLHKPFDLRRLARSLAQATGRAQEELLPK